MDRQTLEQPFYCVSSFQGTKRDTPFYIYYSPLAVRIIIEVACLDPRGVSIFMICYLNNAALSILCRDIYDNYIF